MSLFVLNQFSFDSQQSGVFYLNIYLCVYEFFPVKNSHFTIAGQHPKIFFLIKQELGYIIMGNGGGIIFFMTEAQVSVTIETLQPVVGTDPHKTLFVLQTCCRFIGRQAGGYAIMRKCILTRPLPGYINCQEKV